MMEADYLSLATTLRDVRISIEAKYTGEKRDYLVVGLFCRATYIADALSEHDKCFNRKHFFKVLRGTREIST